MVTFHQTPAFHKVNQRPFAFGHQSLPKFVRGHLPVAYRPLSPCLLKLARF
jgi:hypothetical protein